VLDIVDARCNQEVYSKKTVGFSELTHATNMGQRSAGKNNAASFTVTL